MADGSRLTGESGGAPLKAGAPFPCSGAAAGESGDTGVRIPFFQSRYCATPFNSAIFSWIMSRYMITLFSVTKGRSGVLSSP